MPKMIFKNIFNNMIFILLTQLLAFGLFCPPACLSGDVLSLMMDSSRIKKHDLGIRPRGYWLRYPDPADIPYKLLAFDDLMAEPLMTYDYSRHMAMSAEEYLCPDYLAENNDGLLNVVYYTGLRNRLGSIRPYSASLWAELPDENPLTSAVQRIYTETGRTFTHNAMGEKAEFPLIEEKLLEIEKTLQPELARVVAEQVIFLLDAYRWATLARRNTDYKDLLAIWSIRDMGQTQFDGLEYFPEMDDCAGALDWPSLYYAGMKLLESSEITVNSLKKLRSKGVEFKGQEFDFRTPIGRIVISGTDKDTHDERDLLLLIDLGGNDFYTGPTGATPALDIPVSLAIDLSGSDRYENTDPAAPAQGAGLLGVGGLIDADGDDTYISEKLSQGAALFGLGFLWDQGGNDTYTMCQSGQGGAYFGVGALIDMNGRDRYYLHGDGQGYGGVGGAGILIDREGDDSYTAEPDPKICFRPDYHSEGRVNYSYAQGAGIGRRGDITDGHSWAGGLGALFDFAGNDKYESGNWSIGCGYWYGIGIAYDALGDDVYRSSVFSQASGAHFAIGALIDEAGDDRHDTFDESSASVGFGHDYTVALLLDREGDDRYEIKKDGFAYGINMSQVFFFDLGGKDTYVRGPDGHCFGEVNHTAKEPPPVNFAYALYSTNVSLFGDIGGDDRYIVKDYASGKETHDTTATNDSRWFSVPADAQDTVRDRYFGMGMDDSDELLSVIPEFETKLGLRYCGESE